MMIKETQFLAHFSNSQGKDFSKKSGLGFLVPCQNLEKTNYPIPRKRLDKEKGGRTNRPYFIGLLWLPPGVQEL